MKEYKTITPCIFLKNGQAVMGFENHETLTDLPPEIMGADFGNSGADRLLVFDLSVGDAEHDAAIGILKKIADQAEVPVICAGNIRRIEDVKKILYAGCARAVLNFEKGANREMLEEASKRFGREKIAAYLPSAEMFEIWEDKIYDYASSVLCGEEVWSALREKSGVDFIVYSEDRNRRMEILKHEKCSGITGPCVSGIGENLMEFKVDCDSQGIAVNILRSSVAWSDFKLNSDGMVPVIVQDYKTDEVLMMAYMNEEAFDTTLKTGKMTYWSRSRNELWTKGLTSGHVQYLKSLTLDCDNDTILAKVSQVGAACHTGNKTCFFQELVKKEYDDTNPRRVFQDVYDVILDRKEHPKEGSYTNYLFDKGIDKILKKVGEECTEIVIAAKNPDKEEIKYEISDFLYHIMVLMAEKGVTWEDITRELARR